MVIFYHSIELVVFILVFNLKVIVSLSTGVKNGHAQRNYYYK